MSKELKFPNINNVVISGRLTRDPELRYTQGGTPVAKLSLAFNRNYQKNGEWQQETGYIDVVVWKERGETCANQLHKGSPVLIMGYFKSGSYTDKNEINRKTFEIVASYVSFLEKSDSQVAVGAGTGNQTTVKKEEDNDVPF